MVQGLHNKYIVSAKINKKRFDNNYFLDTIWRNSGCYKAETKNEIFQNNTSLKKDQNKLKTSDFPAEQDTHHLKK